jgi:hypothetical protein
MCSKSEKFFPAIARVLIVDAFSLIIILHVYFGSQNPQINRKFCNLKGGVFVVLRLRAKREDQR